MGGYGSNRWNGARARRRVENCLVISAPRTRRNPRALAGGRWAWPRYDFAVSYTLRDGVLHLFHPSGALQRVHLDATRPGAGGTRLWFRCPRCGRRVMKLYLPPRSTAFLCRHCHDLSYESAQSSRDEMYDLLFRSKARLWGCSTRVAREIVRAQIGGCLLADKAGRLEVVR